MKPGLDDLGDAAVDDRARVDDDVRVADCASAPSPRVAAAGPARPPRAAMSRSWRLATVSPSIPRPRNSETPERQPACPTAAGSGRAGSRAAGPSAGRAAGRRPRSRTPRSTVASTLRTSQLAGTTVRYGRSAKPTTTQATTQAASSAPGVAGVAEQPAVRPGEREPDEAAERGPQETDVADQRRPQVWRRPDPPGGGRRSA